MLLCLLFLGAAFGLPSPQQYTPWTGYEGYQIWEVNPRSKEQTQWLHDLLEDMKVDSYGEVRQPNIPVELIIPPQTVDSLKQKLTSLHLPYSVSLENYQDYLTTEWQRLADKRDGFTKKAFDLEDFNTYEEILDELDVMITRCPSASGVLCDLYDIGESVEGRPLRVLRIRKEGSDRPAFWMDSAIHAREWVAPATNLKVLDRMTRQYDSDVVVRDLIDRYDWYFLPVMNPDGYEWSWTDDRNWRKSRNVNEGSACMGTDLNRNYDQEWMNAGSSADACSNTYAGSSPASEPETQAVQDEANRLSSSLTAFVSIHTAAQMWLHPFGHVDEDGDCFFAEDDEWMLTISNPAADAVQETFGTVWTRGNTCTVIYPASGTTMDYAKGGAGIQYSTTPELRGPGFNPPPETIDLSYQEFWNGVVAMVNAFDA